MSKTTHTIHTHTRIIHLAFIVCLALGLANSVWAVDYHPVQTTNLPPAPPMPTNLNGSVYSLGGNTLLINGRMVYRALTPATSSLDSSAPPSVGDDEGDGSGGGGFSPALASYSSNDLWLSIALTNLVTTTIDAHTNAVVSTNLMARLTLHGTIPTHLYQLELTTGLTPPTWNPGEIITGADATNVTDFSLVSAATPPLEFFRAHGASNVVFFTGNNYNAYEPAYSGADATNGHLQMEVSNAVPGGGVSGPLPVSYRMGDAASNGIDYTFLSGVTNLSGYLPILQVEPLFVNARDFDKGVSAMLLPGNDYLIDPNGLMARILIIENVSGTSLFEFVTNLSNNVDLAYQPVSNALIASVNYSFGLPNNFARLFTNLVATNISGTNVVLTNIVMENWSGVSNLTDEIKLAIIQTTTNGFTKGDMYFGTGTNGVVGKLSADGTVSNLNWLVFSEESILRGSLYVDQTGVFSNNLIVVSGDGYNVGGGVWRIDSSPNAVLLANITNTHLEGVVTVPNDANKYGPWAGKIIAGAEAANPPAIFAIDTNGVTTAFLLGIEPEDFHIIPTNQDFYINEHRLGAVLKLPRDLLTNYVGDIVITQAGEINGVARIFILHWDAASGTFFRSSVRSPAYDEGFPLQGDFEHGAFAPINFPSSSLPNPE